MVIDIRGTHGSGKSWIVAQLVEKYKWKSYVGEGQATKTGPVAERHLGYVCKKPDCAIVGSYQVKSGFGGGCDLLFPEEVVKRVKMFDKMCKCVVLEGVLVAHTFQRYSDLANEIDNYVFCMLDTPLLRCINRVRKRRAGSKQNKLKPFNTKNITKDWFQINTVGVKCKQAGHRVEIINCNDPLPQIYQLIKESQK